MSGAFGIFVLGAAGLVGAAPFGGQPGDPARSLAWIAIWAAPAGCLAAACATARGAARPWLAVVVWSVGFALLVGARAPGLLWALAASGGLFGIGAALGARRPEAASARAAALLLAGGALAALPSLAGIAGDGPWSPAVAARWLDLSPVSLVLECAGLDWMRHPAVYAPAGADAMGPETRLPWRGFLAGPTVLVVGCALAWWAARTSVRAASHPQE